MDIKFTIATVTYNAGKTILRTLQSVAEQTYPAVEHLIIDGCSTDATMEHVQRYVEQNCDAGHPHCITLVREPDAGLYDAMNKALQAAKGHYIVFLNAGDKLHEPTTLQQLATGLQSYNPGRLPAVVYGQTDIVDDEGRFLHRRRHTAPERLTSKSFLAGMLVCHQSFYARTDLARQTPYDLHWRFSADYDWCIRIMRLAERRNLTLLGSGLTLTDYLNEGLTTRNHRRSLMERLRIMAKHYGWLRTLAAHAWFLVRKLKVEN